MQDKPSLFKPVTEGNPASPAKSTEGTGTAVAAAVSPTVSPAPVSSAQPSSSRPEERVPQERVPDLDMARILEDGMTMASYLHGEAQGNHAQELAFLQQLHHNAQQSNPLIAGIPFQALLQSDALPLNIESAHASFEAAARKIAWNAINPHAPLLQAPPAPEGVVSHLGSLPIIGATDRADPAWAVWEQRLQHHKSQGAGPEVRHEKMVYKRAMPHARRSLSAISPEDEAADQEACGRLNDYLVQKIEQMKNYNALPSQ